MRFGCYAVTGCVLVAALLLAGAVCLTASAWTLLMGLVSGG